MKSLVNIKGIIFMLCASIFTLTFSLISNNLIFFALGEFLTGVIGLLTIVGIFVYLEAQFNFLKLLSASTLISTGLGTFNTYINAPKALGTDWLLYLSSLGISISSVTTAQIVANFYCLFLIIFGYLSRNKPFYSNTARGQTRISYTEETLLQVRKLSSKQKECFTLFILSCLVSLLQICVLCTGLYTFHGLTNENGAVNPLAVLVVSASPLAVFSLGLLSSRLNVLQAQINRYLLLLTYNASLIIQLIWFMGSGRRDLIYAAVLFLFGLRFSYIGKKLPLNRKNVRLLFVFLLLLPILYFGWKLFIFIRVLSYNNPLLLKSNLFDIMSYALSQYFSSDKQFLDKVKQHESSNLSTRAFVLNYLAELIEYRNNKPPLFGQDIYSNILNSLPRFFNDKSSLLLNEGLYHYEYGLPSTDNANSLYFSAYGDFSWFGTLIYPLILFFVFYLALKIFLFSSSPYFIILAVSSLIQLSLTGGESDLTSFIVTFRNLMILFVIFKIPNILLLPKKLNHS